MNVGTPKEKEEEDQCTAAQLRTAILRSSTTAALDKDVDEDANRLRSDKKSCRISFSENVVIHLIPSVIEHECMAWSGTDDESDDSRQPDDEIEDVRLFPPRLLGDSCVVKPVPLRPKLPFPGRLAGVYMSSKLVERPTNPAPIADSLGT